MSMSMSSSRVCEPDNFPLGEEVQFFDPRCYYTDNLLGGKDFTLQSKTTKQKQKGKRPSSTNQHKVIPDILAQREKDQKAKQALKRANMADKKHEKIIRNQSRAFTHRRQLPTMQEINNIEYDNEMGDNEVWSISCEDEWY